MSATSTYSVERHVERLRRQLASGVSQVRAVAQDGGPGLDDALHVVEGLLDEFVKLAAVAPRDDPATIAHESSELPVELAGDGKTTGHPVEGVSAVDSDMLSGSSSEPDIDPQPDIVAASNEPPAIVTVLDETPTPMVLLPDSEENFDLPIVLPAGPPDLVAGSGPASMTIDADFRLVQASEAFLQLFDARPGAFATSCYELLGRVAPCDPCAGGMAHASSGPVTRDVEIGDRVYRVAARPIPLPDGRGVVETFEDVTAEVQSEADAIALGRLGEFSGGPQGPDVIPRSAAPPPTPVWPWIVIAIASLGVAAVALVMSGREASSPPGSRVVSDLTLDELLSGDAPIAVVSSETGAVVDLGPPPGSEPTPMELGAAVRSSVGGSTPGTGLTLPLRGEIPFQDKVADAVARQLVAQGDYAGAALAWEEMIAAELPNRWTIGLETNCRTSSLSGTLGRFSSDPSVVFKSVTLGGQECYFVLYGSFPTREAAEAAVKFLPAPYRGRALDDFLIRTFRRLP